MDTFELVSVLLFRESEEGIGSVEVVDVGKPVNITTQLDEAYPTGPDSFWTQPYSTLEEKLSQRAVRAT
jgi:hypothetical protein